MLEVVPMKLEHLEEIKKLFASEGWHPEELHSGNTIVLVNEHGKVFGGIHFEVLPNGMGEIKFIKVSERGERHGDKLVQEALKELFKHVNMVVATPKGLSPRIKRFFERNGFREALGGKMAIKKGEWRARRRA